LYRSGRQADALDAFRRARSVLLDELGLDPSPRLQALERAILSQDEALAAPTADPMPPSNLPTPRDDLIGRERELGELIELQRADEVRLVTLTGPGGVGKTRLATAAATAAAASFAGHAYFADLGAIRDPGGVLAALGEPFELREEGPRTLRDALVARLRGRQVLLVVDNFEQVQAAAPVVADLLAAVRGLTVVVTSRVRLRLSGEHEYAVQPLAGDDAVALFGARARAVRGNVEIDATAAARLCDRLDGLPLAIELAAARTRLLSPEALLERLDRRLDSLGEGARDLPARQRRLRATLDWSHELLSADEQAAFARLAVFVGGCSVESAEAVTGAALETLEALVDSSLVFERGGRLEMLATMREYAAERLDERGELLDFRRRHALHVAELAERIEAWSIESDEARWYDLLEREHDNVRAALEWSVDARDPPELALRIAAASAWFWFVRGHFRDGRRWLEAALSSAGDAPDSLRGKAFIRLGALGEAEGDYPRAAEAYAESARVRSEIGDVAGVVAARTNLANVAYYLREFEDAVVLYEESLESARGAGDTLGVAALLCNLALVHLSQGRARVARTLLEESLALARSLDAPYGVAHVLQALGATLADEGEVGAATDALGESLDLFASLEARREAAVTLEEIAALAAGFDLESAAALLGAAQAMRDGIGAAPTGPQEDRSARTRAQIRDRLGPSRLDRALADGRSTPPFALAEVVLAQLRGGPAKALADDR